MATKSALLVIDMQDEFVRPGWNPFWVPDCTRQVAAIACLVVACRELGVPVIWTLFSATHHYLDRPHSGSTMPELTTDQAPRASRRL